MSLGPSRWHTLAESGFAWERKALNWLRAQLSDRDPWYVWSNFELIDNQGKVNEVDALVLSPAGLFLVEFKNHSGKISGNAHSWTWTTDGCSKTVDKPLLHRRRPAQARPAGRHLEPATGARMPARQSARSWCRSSTRPRASSKPISSVCTTPWTCPRSAG
ncbi:NERD domain-containing protein [Azotobacter armeniacus]